MHKFEGRFDGVYGVSVIADPGVILFSLEDAAMAIGYSKIGAAEYHIKKRVKIVAGDKFVDLKTLNSLAKKATRTPRAKEFAAWAKEVQDKELARQQAAAHIAKQPKPQASAWPYPTGKTPEGAYNLADAAGLVGMDTGAFKQWLIAEGYADVYASNGNLRLSKWFKAQGYGKLAQTETGSVSNTPRITKSGIEFLKNRASSQRESNVLSFALTKSAEEKRLESDIDKLILEKFKRFETNRYYTKMLNQEAYYEIDDYAHLLKTVKEIIAEVKLK